MLTPCWRNSDKTEGGTAPIL